MVTLPIRGYDPQTGRSYTPRRAWLIGFWLALVAPATLVTLVATAAAGRPGTAAGAAAAGALLALAGCLRPRGVVVAYKIWNRLADGYGLFVRTCLLGLCFGIVRAARVDCTDRLALARTERPSMWVPFGPATAHLPAALDGGAVHWTRELAARASLSGERWSLWLAPFLLLLECICDDEEPAAPAGIYTLF